MNHMPIKVLHRLLDDFSQGQKGPTHGYLSGVTEFRQPLQVQSHLEMPRILVQLGHIQRT